MSDTEEEKKFKLSNEQKFYAKWIGLALSAIAVIVLLGMWLMPHYNIYKMRLSGEAKLRQLEFTKRGAIEGAKAKLESAKLLAAAEVERAKGVSKANKIIGDSLKGNDAYLRYLWIQGLHDGSSEVIYIATEAGLPILEAGRGLRRKK